MDQQIGNAMIAEIFKLYLDSGEQSIMNGQYGSESTYCHLLQTAGSSL
jgi:hypothetical protein